MWRAQRVSAASRRSCVVNGSGEENPTYLEKPSFVEKLENLKKQNVESEDLTFTSNEAEELKRENEKEESCLEPNGNRSRPLPLEDPLLWKPQCSRCARYRLGCAPVPGGRHPVRDSAPTRWFGPRPPPSRRPGLRSSCGVPSAAQLCALGPAGSPGTSSPPTHPPPLSCRRPSPLVRPLPPPGARPRQGPHRARAQLPATCPHSPSAFGVAMDALAARSSDQVPAPLARSGNSGIQSPAGEAGTRTQGTLPGTVNARPSARRGREALPEAALDTGKPRYLVAPHPPSSPLLPPPEPPRSATPASGRAPPPGPTPRTRAAARHLPPLTVSVRRGYGRSRRSQLRPGARSAGPVRELRDPEPGGRGGHPHAGHAPRDRERTPERQEGPGGAPGGCPGYGACAEPSPSRALRVVGGDSGRLAGKIGGKLKG
eukprot:XP_017447831.1 PREDICTED: basic proline-rich protein-like [Rattus norvegicus]